MGFLSKIGSTLSGAGSFLSGAASVAGLFGSGGLSPRQQMATQQEYWRQQTDEYIPRVAESARKAGISPLAAIGANLSISPPSPTFTDSGSNKYVDAAAGLGRSMEAYQDSKQRNLLFSQETRMNELKIQNAEIEVQKNAADLVLRRTGATIPMNPDDKMLIPGQGNSVGLVQNLPSKLTSSRAGDSSTEAAGPAPATREFVNRDGSVTVWPSEAAKNAIEDSPYEWEHMFRNRFVPWFQERSRYSRRGSKMLYDYLGGNPRYNPYK